MKGTLTIKRGPGESFFIGDTVKVTVARIQGGEAVLHIEAPLGLRIMREELLNRPKDALAHLPHNAKPTRNRA